MNKNRLRVLVIGTKFGSMVHIPSFISNPRVKIVGLCGRDVDKTKKIAEKHKITNIYNDYSDAVSADDVDLISISAPPELHAPIALEAIGNRRHVLCEKPMALSVNEAKEMLDSLTKNKVKGFVGHQMRFQLQRKAIKNIIDGGDLGKIIHVNLSYSTSNRIEASTPWNWWSDINLGGGELYAMGSHQIDLLLWWLGDVEAVNGELRRLHNKRVDISTGKPKPVTSDDLASFQLYFKSGAYASCVVSSVAIGWKGAKIEIYGEKGSLFVDGEQNLFMFRKTTATHDLSLIDPLLTEQWVSGSEWRASFWRMSDSIVDHLLDGAQYEGATFSDGLKVQKVIDAILESDKEKTRIVID